jgi:peptidoglycan/xylan/chitin deacetylase (PgdA/CDA1 family)
MNLPSIVIFLFLLVSVFGLPGCRSTNSPLPQPTPPVGLTAAEARPDFVLTPQPAAASTPTPALLATKPALTANLAPETAPRLPPLEPTLINHGDRALLYIALTFDACQTEDRPAGYDETIINILTETGTPATLFLGGLWMQRHPTQTRALAANPLFELGNHAWSHPDFTRLNPEEMSLEILRTQEMMFELTGRQPALFRFPYDAYTDEALAVVGQHGLRTIRWDILTGDPDPRISAQDIIYTVTTEAQNGSIIIMHMNTWGWHTAEALPTIITQLRDEGYTFVTVSQLLELASPPEESSDKNGKKDNPIPARLCFFGQGNQSPIFCR